MSLTTAFFNGAFNPNAKQDPWNRYMVSNPPPITDPFSLPSWYYKGQEKVAEYKGYKSMGVEPNDRWWSDSGEGYKGYGSYLGSVPSGSFTNFSGRKKKRRRGGYRIPRR